MSISRRKFLVTNLVAVEAFCLSPGLLDAQDDNWSTIRQPPIVEGKSPLNDDPSTRAALAEQNRKAIKKDVQTLYDLAAQLKADVEKTDSRAVLSLGLVKRAEEIEKLAKHIKSCAKS